MAQGTSFGHYELRELLGRGGMGEVYRAFDPTMNRMVALKLLPPHLAGDPSFEQRFRREAVAAAALSNPHVIPIHSSGEIDGRLYVDMRLVEGPELQQLLHGGPLTAERAVRIIEQIAGALDAAHAVGLIHRDVKPSNIMLGPDDFAYLIDFGIAQAAGDTRLTQAGEALGTVDYMAPERFEGAAATPSSDIYALACVLYQCLTGTPPFASKSMQQAIAGHMMQPPPRASDMGVGRAFDDVVARGMAKQPARRHGSARALASAARAALTAPSPRAQPVLDFDDYSQRRQGVSPWSPQAARYQPVAPVVLQPPLSVPPRPLPPPASRPPISLPPRHAPPPPAPVPWQSRVGDALAPVIRAIEWVGLRIQALLRPAVRIPGGKWILMAVGVVILIVVTVTPFALMVRSSQPAAEEDSALPDSVLEHVMLSRYELSSLAGADDLNVAGDTGEFRDSSDAVDDKPCLGVVSIGEKLVYDGTGWVKVRSQFAGSAAPEVRHVRQSATLFESHEDATSFFGSSRDVWERCAERDIEWNEAGVIKVWRADAVDDVSETIIAQTTTLTNDGTDEKPDWDCPHAMGVRANVVVEASVCGAAEGRGVDRAIGIAQAMLKDVR